MCSIDTYAKVMDSCVSREFILLLHPSCQRTLYATSAMES